MAASSHLGDESSCSQSQSCFAVARDEKRGSVRQSDRPEPAVLLIRAWHARFDEVDIVNRDAFERGDEPLHRWTRQGEGRAQEHVAIFLQHQRRDNPLLMMHDQPVKHHGARAAGRYEC